MLIKRKMINKTKIMEIKARKSRKIKMLAKLRINKKKK